MKRFFRIFSGISALPALLICLLLIYGTYALPDEITLSGTVVPGLGELFDAQAPDDAKASEYSSSISALGIIPVKNVKVNVRKRRYVGIGGDVFGIKMYTLGVLVVGVDSVTTEKGSSCPAAEADIRQGDVIIRIGNRQAESASEVTLAIENSGGKELPLTVERSGEILKTGITPVLSSGGKYRAGLWVRDSSAGIGTVTFYDDENMVFAGLGHGVCDADTGKIMPLSRGEAVGSVVNGFRRSNPGDPGELCGTFSPKVIGSLRANLDSGIFGVLNAPSGAKTVPVALEHEVRVGAAQIITTIDENGPRYFDIEITKVYPLSDASTRNLIIKVTDPELLEKTGGIVQGMSGSPIIQNSMLVGAVTHVFVNDPEKGYGIFAERMLNSLDSLSNDNMGLAS